jgi:hypothetical protein
MALRHGNWAVLVCGCALVLMACASSPRRQPAAAAIGRSVRSTYVTRCEPKHTWLQITPRMTPELVYGVGGAQTAEAAADVARADAAKAISVEIREDMTDSQVLWLERSGSSEREVSQERISRAASSSVDRRLESCELRAKCSDDHENIHVLVACARRSSLERELIGTARTLVSARATVGALLGVPGSDGNGYVTQLGLYALNVVRDALLASGSAAYPIVSTASWEPANLHEAARNAKATHLLRVEYQLLDVPRVRFSVYVQEVATDRHVAGADAAFEVELDPGQLVLLSIVGPLLPQKSAQDLVNTAGAYPVPLRLSKTDLREGETVVIELTMPREGFVYVYDIYEDGRADLLMPSRLSPANRFAAESVVRLPDSSWKQAGAELRACPLNRQKLTREYVKVIVSPLALDFGASSSGNASPNIGALQARLEELKRSGVPLGTAEMPYFIRAASRPVSACQSSKAAAGSTLAADTTGD